jgi:hypothetical protein
VLAVSRPTTTTGHLGETDAQAQRDAVAGQGQDLVPDHGVRDVPGAVGGVGSFLELDHHADGQGAGVPGVGGREGHPGRVGALQGAAGERLGDEPAPVDHAGANAPREKRADQGPPVAIVPKLQVGGIEASL